MRLGFLLDLVRGDIFRKFIVATNVFHMLDKPPCPHPADPGVDPFLECLQVVAMNTVTLWAMIHDNPKSAF